MSRAAFPVITGTHWALAIARGRSEGNRVLAQIRAAVAAKTSNGIPASVPVPFTSRCVMERGPVHSVSQPGTGRACVPLELARTAEHCASVQASSKPVSMSLDCNLPSESGERGTKTACTQAASRAENSFTVAGRLADAGRIGDRRSQCQGARAHVGGGESLSASAPMAASAVPANPGPIAGIDAGPTGNSNLS